MNKKMYIVAILVFAVISMALTYGDGHDDFWKNYEPTNLKILPDDISGEQLEQVMDAFSEALDVKCSYCHAFKKGSEKHLDFASDDKKEKHISRGMMKMVNGINKHYFLKHQKGDEKVEMVSCITCHNGNKEPKTITTMRGVVKY